MRASRYTAIAVISLFTGMSLLAAVLRTDLWPFSPFGMFSRLPELHRPRLRLVAELADGRRTDPFQLAGALRPADRFLILRSLSRTLLEEQDQARAKAALAWLLELSERNSASGAYQGPAFRSVAVETGTGSDFEEAVRQEAAP